MESEYQIVALHAGQSEIAAGVLRVSGPDRVRWLHKLITADVEHLTTGQGVHGALLEAKGHFIADFVALALEDSFLLLVDSGARELLLSNLRRYIIREKVRVDDESDRYMLMTVIGPEADALVSSVLHSNAPTSPFYWTRVTLDSTEVILIRGVRAPFPAIDFLVSLDASDALARALNAPLISAELLDVLRVETGLPRWGIDFDSTTLALEIPDAMSIRVDQGCYIGQEVVARLVHRGHVNRRLVGLRMEGQVPEPGTPISYEDNRVGAITSAVLSPRLGGIAMGYVRREVAGPGTEVRVGENARARVTELPFAQSR